MRKNIPKKLLFKVLLQIIVYSGMIAAPLFAKNGHLNKDSTDPASKIVVLIVSFSTDSAGSSARIIDARLAEGSLKPQISPVSKPGNIICQLKNAKQTVAVSEIDNPLEEHIEYPSGDNTLSYKKVVLKEKKVLLRFQWQPGLESLQFFSLENNKALKLLQEIPLPTNITQPK